MKLTKYVESFIEKCTRDADDKCNTLSEELEEVKSSKLVVEGMVLKLTAENRKLKVRKWHASLDGCMLAIHHSPGTPSYCIHNCR